MSLSYDPMLRDFDIKSTFLTQPLRRDMEVRERRRRVVFAAECRGGREEALPDRPRSVPGDVVGIHSVAAQRTRGNHGIGPRGG